MSASHLTVLTQIAYRICITAIELDFLLKLDLNRCELC